MRPVRLLLNAELVRYCPQLELDYIEKVNLVMSSTFVTWAMTISVMNALYVVFSSRILLCTITELWLDYTNKDTPQ